jgi:hypothetical protein
VDESAICEGKDKGGRGRHVNLLLNSTEGKYAIDLIEKGYSYATATEILNRILLMNGKNVVGKSSVVNLAKSIEHIKVSLTKKKQGDVVSSSKWAQARLNWAKQLAVRLNLIPPEINEVYPKWFDINYLSEINPIANV